MIFRKLAFIPIIGITIVACATTATTKKLPGQSIADAQLQRDTMGNVAILEYVADNTCKQRKVVDTEVIDYPANSNKDSWTERWTLDRCGNTVKYKVTFTPDPKGGTSFNVSTEK